MIATLLAAGMLAATLKNGMHVVLLPNKLAPVTTTVMTYGVGSDDDTMPGIAHATEHMMFRGSTDVSATQFAEMAARAGAQYNAETTSIATTYYFEIPSAYTGLALRLEADRMNGALDRQSDWDTERSAIEQEVRAHQSVPGAALQAKVRRAFFGDVPYAHDGVGTIDSFQKMRASDIAAFYKIVVSPEQRNARCRGRHQSAKRSGGDSSRLRFHFAGAGTAAQGVYDCTAHVDDTERYDLQIPVPVASVVYRFPDLRSPDYAAGMVLSTALSSGRGTLADLQAQGKLLGAFAISSAYRDIGVMIVAGAGLPSTTPAAVRSQLESALDGYRRDGIPADLVQAAKQRLLSQQDYRQASIAGLAFSWANALSLSGQPPDAQYASIQNVTVDDVNHVLRTYMNPKGELDVLMQPKPGASVARNDSASAEENVTVHAGQREPMPSWAAAYFSAPLRIPQSDTAVRTFHLRNGLTLTVRPETFSPTVVLRGYIENSADLYEPRGKDGVSQIAEALLPWGTTTYGRTEYQAQADAIAANIGLGTSFGVTVQAKNFDRAIQLLADGMLHPAFPAQAFSVVQNNTARTLAAMEHQPSTIAEIAQTDALYPPGDPLLALPDRCDSRHGTLGDVKHWYTFAYRPDLTTIAIVGDVTPQVARDTIERYFGAWHAPKTKPPSFKYPQIKSNQGKSVTVNSSTTTHSQVTLTQIIDVHSGERDAIALELANTMLSDEGTGSLLFRDLRTQHGYVYSADSSLDIGENTSTFSIYFASDSKNVPKAQAAAIAEIRRLQDEDVPDIELQRAKALLLAERVLPLDSYSGIARDILDTAKDGLTVSDENAYWGKLLRITPSQVRAAMKRWIRVDRFSRVIVAPGS